MLIVTAYERQTRENEGGMTRAGPSEKHKDTREDGLPDQYEKRYAWCCSPHPNPTANRPAKAMIKTHGDDEPKANRATGAASVQPKQKKDTG